MLRQETRTFTSLNLWILWAVLAGFGVERLLRGVAGVAGVARFLDRVPLALQEAGLWLALFCALMPVATTLALLWKIKEAIFTSLFNAER
jgi:hypothetical protein